MRKTCLRVFPGCNLMVGRGGLCPELFNPQSYAKNANGIFEIKCL